VSQDPLGDGGGEPGPPAAAPILRTEGAPHEGTGGGASARPRIALLGLFGVGNVGNESSLEAVSSNLRRVLPGAEITCICADPHRVHLEHGLEALPLRKPLRPSVHAIRSRPLRLAAKTLLRIPTELADWVRVGRLAGRFDAIIVPGTGILDDFGMHAFQMPYDLLKWSLLGRLRGHGLWYVSIGAGPIRRPLSRLFMKTAARLADYRSYRDELSRDYLRGIGLDTGQDAVYPDVVYSVPAAAEFPPPRCSPRTIAVGLMEYRGWRNRGRRGEGIYREYLDRISTFVAWLLEQGYEVRLVTGEGSDDHAVTAVRARLGALAARVQAEPVTDTDDLLRQLAAADLVVATRFHNVLCALMLDRPVISIGYARKNDVLMQSVGLGDYCQAIEMLDLERLKQQFRDLASHAPEACSRLHGRNVENRRLLEEQYARLASRLLGESARS
jgi:polysaccharide pyruvyl transferase WcaK-like protein